MYLLINAILLAIIVVQYFQKRMLRWEIRTSKKQPVIRVDHNAIPQMQTKIKYMPIGVEMYAVPWSYNVITKSLDGNFTCYPNPEGTVSMPVIRKSPHEFEVDVDFSYFGNKYRFKS